MVYNKNNENISANSSMQFAQELKLYINKRLYEKQIISEEMYLSVKDRLVQKKFFTKKR